jgi:hypothetical protein
MSQPNETKQNWLPLVINGIEMGKELEPVEDGDFPQRRVVPNSWYITIVLDSGQKIKVKGDEIRAAMPFVHAISDAVDALRLDPLKDSVIIDFPREQQ